ncbi:ABC transporter permease [Puia dinghuensis]|uniref:ABC transporter permease n=1 Tax=Puia dinghuensis TaxID=1792502 RepID=A0A8J2UE77_9BACT|nr:ABC transporter permease [Puia dinghuensis]GGB05574.1 ABC transporter permease [Puia dinghuensis]
MLRNYLRIAFRNLWQHKGFTFLNIIGLTVGMVAFFLIFLYVRFELSYDSMHSKADRIYRIVCDIKTPTETLHASQPSWAVPPHLTGELPEVESAVRVGTGDTWLVYRGDQQFAQDDVAVADSTFLQIFDFPLLKGDRKTALKEPFSVVLTETTAKKFFGSADPMGKSLALGQEKLHATVTGVLKDIPDNSIIKASMIVSMNTITQRLNRGLDDQWGNYGPNGYVLLKPGASAAALEKKFPAFLEKMNGTEMHKINMIPTLFLEPLRDVYLRSTRDGSKTGNITDVYIFSIIGVFILLIACINFINLTTARSADRAKEVGIRKVVGAVKGQLARQFIGESVILCLMALLLAVILTALLIHPFNQIAGKIISPGIFSHPGDLLILLGIAILIGIAAGLYPALVLSSFQPVSVLKGRFATGARGTFLRKALVIVQFTIATGLIIGTLVVYNQLNYMRSQDLGFNKDQKMVCDTRGDSSKLVLKQAVSGLPGVLSTAMSGSVPGGGNPGAYSQIENTHGEMQIANLDLYFVDFDYIPQFKMKMVAGRAFSRAFLTDTTNAMVLNEAAVKLFGYRSPKEAVGRRFDQWGRKGTIIGVVQDFHFRSLQEVIKPLSMRIEPRACDLLSINIDGQNIPATIGTIEKTWKRLMPDKPFSYFFLDEFFDKQYRAEDRFGKLFLYFAVLAIVISCLGLMGLASYSTLQRTKEIGVRKIVGASVGNIVFLLSKDFLQLVAWSFLVAFPVSWFLLHGWLKSFAYRISVYWWIFAAAGMMALLVALLTISFQSIRAAVASPVKSLRTE